ncbi:sugar-binding domain-containing protein [Mucilaginibacter gossypiicola]|uniref:sugar-binding domain-containing protein n=1 Tax=Mucilaginibacter gossypiicola TaxID=551995 RepID=UPI000B897D7C|nr:sugar-binding domain-containing protein [Mucilaginibacter gossypiicola]
MIRIKCSVLFLFLLTPVLRFLAQNQGINHRNLDGNSNTISLAGKWAFEVDSLDAGVTEKWYNRPLKDIISLPGSMTTNGKGKDISITTPWTGSIIDSGWFYKPEYKKYRAPGHVKVPFWLQPVKYYKGPAWYQKEILIPAGWAGNTIKLFLERCHWYTDVWIDNKYIGELNSLGTPDIFNLGSVTPGKHRLTIRVDNGVQQVDVGQNSHSISDHTQGNWNGIAGKIVLQALHKTYLEDVQVFSDIRRQSAALKFNIVSGSKSLPLRVACEVYDNEERIVARKNLDLKNDSAVIHAGVDILIGKHVKLWDEFHPNLYRLRVLLSSKGSVVDSREITFGMREFATNNTQFTINGRLTFLRGTLDCAAYPITGYPPTDVAAWSKIFRQCKSFGLNHIRFHSWCPPEAAFTAADQAGLYLQIECSSWANQGATIGDGKPLDKFIYQESERIVKAFGNHPSFCMLLYGNEPDGPKFTQYLTDFVKYWKGKDSRRLYTTGAGWPIIAGADYNSSPDPRIQAWGSGLNSIINAQPPGTDYDWHAIIAKWNHPTVSHEIGQWCVYPDFSEIQKYKGVLQAKNFEIFQDQLQQNGLGQYAKGFLYNSGRLQSLCYKADIEAALRTPGFGGFQLLGLNDFPGQGTALVGVVNPFWETKGYINADEYRQFCNAVVPLARFSKMIWESNEILRISVEVAQFSESVIRKPDLKWRILSSDKKIMFQGTFPGKDVPNGNGIKIAEISQNLSGIMKPCKLTLEVNVAGYKNTWDFFVYPHLETTNLQDILVTQTLDKKAEDVLLHGGKVLWSLKKGSLKKEFGGEVQIGFSSIFWNTAWTGGQAPHTLGIMCDPAHPAFRDFPTQSYSNWQWWDAIVHSNAIELDKVKSGLKPIVRVIDDWVTARSLGLVFEARVGNGQLIVSGIDLVSEIDKRPSSRQLKYSLINYMHGTAFDPKAQISIENLKSITN